MNEPRVPEDLSRISLNEQFEIAYWTNQFAMSHGELEKVIAHVGPTPEAVREHIEGGFTPGLPASERIDPWRP
jgi:hypothetical protein